MTRHPGDWPGLAYDMYYGGTRDGQLWELDRSIRTAEIADPSGEVYQRHPDMDSPNARAWVLVQSIKPTAANGVHVEPQPGAKFLCLQDLRTLLTIADRMGHDQAATVYGRVGWRGEVLTLGIKAAG